MCISLKKGGILYMAFPCEESITFPSREGTLNFYDDPTHVKPFTKHSIFSSLKMSNFKEIYVNDFMQLPSTWKIPFLRKVYSLIGKLFPENFKWKSTKGRNTNDRKFIRFSKENMILAFCKKEA